MIRRLLHLTRLHRHRPDPTPTPMNNASYLRAWVETPPTRPR